MKYVNSQKYMNGFSRSGEGFEISSKRLRLLCERLGRVELGAKYICLPHGGAGHACAVMLENVMLKAGHKVGRISASAWMDSRNSIFVSGAVPSIDDYNRAVAELKSAVQKLSEERFCMEEAVFALGLLLCRLNGCEYMILEGLSDGEHSLDAVCAPYDMIVMPTVYESHGATDTVSPLCSAIRRGTREVVSGNQKSEVYNKISNACAMSGVRLYIPVKAQFEAVEVSARKLVFNYGGREGYSMRSPSYVLRDCAMTVIESSLALRRGGLKLPWGSIMEGIAATAESGCFELISASPIIITDSASCREEAELLLKTYFESCAHGEEKSLILCVPAGMNEILPENTDGIKIIYCENVAVAAEQAVAECDDNTALICFGGLEFSHEMKTEIVKILNK